MSSILLTASRKYPAIPTVGGDVVSHTKAIEALRDAVQTHERRTNDKLSSFVRIKELIDLGVVRLIGDNKVELAVVSSTGETGSIALGDLSDVDLAGLTDGDVLTYDAVYGLWVPTAPSSSSGSSENVTPSTHPASPNAADDEFEGAALDTAGTRRSGATAWATRNPGAATFNLAQGALIITAPSSAGINLRMAEQAIPSGAWRYRCKVQPLIPQTNFARAGMFVCRSAASKALEIATAYSSGAKIEANSWNITGPYIGAIGSSVGLPGDQYLPFHFEIEYDGSSIYTFRWSKSGYDGTFTTTGTQAQATNLGGAADKIGVYVNTESSAGIAIGIFDWFRRMA